MHEFTGERVIPGLVDADLFNEHLSRYRFASQFVAPGMTVLDAGCGSGYGTVELARARRVIAMDIATDAVEHARENHARANVHFAAGSCAAIPFGAGSFDVIAAFEVIEHLNDYRALVGEARRTLKTGGTFLVSTPNREYYAESRAAAGPNPFHVREFDYGEFSQALSEFFPHVEIWTQNHTDSIVFTPAAPNGALAESAGAPEPVTAHFFLAACSESPIARRPLFAWIPSVANTLRERELHIAKLDALLADALERHQSLERAHETLLGDALARHEALQREHERLLSELERSNRWAAELNLGMARRDARISELQEEAAARLEWIRDLEGQIARGRAEIENLNGELASRTEWARTLEAELARDREELGRRRAELAMLSESRWVRLGRKLRVGPEVNGL